jgi:solute carrier family 25 carnitine/acylcarnitine transporter 20/29
MSLLVDCLSGAIAGVSGSLLGHPLDTIRVKLQAGQGKSALAVSRELSREGVLGFYRGFLPPLLSVGVASTLAFSTNEVAKRALLPERREGWRYYAGLVGSGELPPSFVCVPQ